MSGKPQTSQQRLANAVRSVVILAWIAGMIWLLDHDHYRLFVRAELWPLLLGGLVLLFLFAYPALLRMKVTDISTPPLRRLAAAGIMLLPLAYLFAAPSGGLDSHAFDKRQTDATWSAHDGVDRSAATGRQEHIPGVGEVTFLTLDELTQNGPALAGQRVRTLGRVHRDTVDNTAILYRFVIVCCAADARPLAVRLTGDLGEDIREDDWVDVIGTVRPETDSGLPGFVLEVEMSRRIDHTPEPYLYLNDD